MSGLLASLASSVVSECSCELNDAVLLENAPPVAKQQRLVVASARTAVKVRGEDVFINTILCDGRTSLQGIYEFNCNMPPTLLGYCCLV